MLNSCVCIISRKNIGTWHLVTSPQKRKRWDEFIASTSTESPHSSTAQVQIKHRAWLRHEAESGELLRAARPQELIRESQGRRGERRWRAAVCLARRTVDRHRRLVRSRPRGRRRRGRRRGRPPSRQQPAATVGGGRGCAAPGTLRSAGRARGGARVRGAAELPPLP